MKRYLYILAFVSSLIIQAQILDIKMQCNTTKDQVFLKDIVNHPHLLSSETENLLIFNTPAKGKSKTYSLVDIAYAMQKHTALKKMKIRGNGLTITNTGIDMQVQKIKHDIQKELSKTSPWKGWETDVIYELDDDLGLNKVEKYNTLKVKILDSRRLLGNVPMLIKFMNSEGIEVATRKISPTIIREVDALIARDSLASGDIISEEDLQLTKISISDDSRQYLNQINECIGREISKNIGAGEIITSKVLNSPPCAKRGDMIRVTSTLGALEVKVTVKALQDGRMSEYIRVENPSSRKRFTVKLTGHKEGIYELFN